MYWLRWSWWWRTEDGWQTHLIKQCLFFELAKKLCVCMHARMCVHTRVHTHMWVGLKTSRLKKSLPLLWGMRTKSLRYPWPCFLVYYIAGLPNLGGVEVLEWIQGSTKWFLWGKVRRRSLPPLKGERARGDQSWSLKCTQKPALVMWWTVLGLHWG